MIRTVLFEDSRHSDLNPLVYWRSVFELRCGRKTFLDRAAHVMQSPINGLWVRDEVAKVASERFQLPVNQAIRDGTLLLNGRLLADRSLQLDWDGKATRIATCDGEIAYVCCGLDAGGRFTPQVFHDQAAMAKLLGAFPTVKSEATLVRYPWDLVRKNASMLESDWSSEDGAKTGTISSSAHLIDPDNIHVGEMTVVDPGACLDAREGPIYISDHCRIHPNAHIAGPAYIGPGSVVKPFSQIHGGTTLGPMCKVGGEIDGTIIGGYTNKQHAGFLGHSYVGSWVNIGAGTSNSDLKNTYGTVRAISNGQEFDTGTMFYGAVIGDHAKIGIQEAIPTGASIGFAAVTATAGMLPKFVPSFSWLVDGTQTTGDPKRLAETVQIMMRRRNVDCTEADVALFISAAETAKRYESQA
jgi:UDP-N-acetylglucosamine diphosphorylase/glucosamine-1-phosphate N-acetyltransferase